MSELKLFGYALLEGVSISGAKGRAAAVRNEDGDIVYRIRREQPARSGLTRLLRSGRQLWQGLTWSARQVGDTADEPLGVFPVIGSVLGSLILAALVFVFLPAAASSFAARFFSPALCCLVEGLLRDFFLLLFLLRLNRFNDIKRLKGYNAAAHQAVAAYEAQAELSPDSLSRFPLRDRGDGLSLALTVVFVLIPIFAFVNQLELLPRILVKLALLLAAALAGEALWRSAGRRSGGLSRLLLAPSLLVQCLLIRRPDPSQQEVAIAALLAVADVAGDHVEEARRLSSPALSGSGAVAAAAAQAYMQSLAQAGQAAPQPAAKAKGRKARRKKASSQQVAAEINTPIQSAAEGDAVPAASDQSRAAAALMDAALADLLTPGQASPGRETVPAENAAETGAADAIETAAEAAAGSGSDVASDIAVENTDENAAEGVDESDAAQPGSLRFGAALGRQTAAAADALAAAIVSGGREVGQGASRLADAVSRSVKPGRREAGPEEAAPPSPDREAAEADRPVAEAQPAQVLSPEEALAQAKAQAQEKAAAQAEALAAAQAEAEAVDEEARAKARAKAKAQSEARRRARAKKKARAAAEARARAKQEEEAAARQAERARQEAEAAAEARAQAEQEAQARAEAQAEASRSPLREPEEEPAPDPAPEPAPAPTPPKPRPRSGYRNGKYVEQRPRPSQESANRMQRIANNIGLKVDRIYGDVEYYDPSDADVD